ncbi:tyrosine-type recombinase/integrase [Lactobacillus johnsonii]|uniref:tyrosine-type recombinase/integrase n=1 Tax=Lactobacillus johnsonii TaxID=33959 RepID=UPI003D67B5FA
MHRNEPEKNKRHSKSNSAKTGNSNRDVLLSDDAVKLVKEHFKGKKLNDFLFVNEWPTSDGYFIPGKVNNVLKSIARRQGIKKDLTSHFFRHTHISKLAELGVPLYVIQKRVGHGNSRITREIYLHVTDKVKKDLKNKLDMLDVSSDLPSLKVLKN